MREVQRRPMTVYAPVMGIIWRTVESYGLNPRRFIKADVYHPGMDPGLSDRMSFQSHDRIFSKVVESIDDPALGLRFAEHFHPSQLGAFGFAWMASSSILTALKRSQRFSRMLNESIKLDLEENANELVLTWHMFAHTATPDVRADYQLGCTLVMCRANLGNNFRPSHVSLRRQAPVDKSPWEEFFGVGVHFGQDANAITISRKDAIRPLLGQNKMLVALHEDVLNRQISDLKRSDVLGRAKVELIDQLPSGDVTIETIASALNMSKRTLHRRLLDEGLSFRSRLQDVRKKLVTRYVGEPRYSVTEIAFLLGYSDSSAFSRAFKSWFGMSLTQAREAGGI